MSRIHSHEENTTEHTRYIKNKQLKKTHTLYDDSSPQTRATKISKLESTRSQDAILPWLKKKHKSPPSWICQLVCFGEGRTPFDNFFFFFYSFYMRIFRRLGVFQIWIILSGGSWYHNLCLICERVMEIIYLFSYRCMH